MTLFLENLKRHNQLLTSIELSSSLIHANYDLFLSEIQLWKICFLKLSNDSASKEDFGMDVKGEVFLQVFNKSKLRNGTKTFLEPKFFFIFKFKKLRFSAPLITGHILLKLSIK